MSNDVLSLEDLALKAGVPADRLAEWSKAKLLKPDGFSDEKAPLFAPASLDRVAHIRRLADLGYGTDEIAKIVKKVGLPREDRGRKKGAEKAKFLTVGNLAERSGVSPRTIKHWEDKGIIGPDMRTEGGFRLYPDPTSSSASSSATSSSSATRSRRSRRFRTTSGPMWPSRRGSNPSPSPRWRSAWRPCSKPSRPSSPR